MAENIRMDSHKLIYHPDVVARWMRGENIYPIEIEISPSGACNHRCTFCAVDYIGYEPAFLDKDIILRDISRMSKKGLKSIICSGEGEPLLNKNMSDIANGIKVCGVDVAMSTNGVLFTKEKAEEMNEDDVFVAKISAEEDAILLHNTEVQLAEDEGIKKGKFETAKALLADKVPIEKIQTYTGLSKETILKLI